MNASDFPADVAEGEFSRFSRTLLTLGAVFTIIILVVGVFGNLLTIISLIRCPKVRNIAASFIISLCLADFIFCIFVLPFNAIRFIHGYWRLGTFLCKMVPFVQYGSIGVSLLCIAMITVNRYVMIVHHSAYAQVYQKHWIVSMILFCWLFSYGMQVPTLLGVWGAFAYDKKLGTCSILPDENGRSTANAVPNNLRPAGGSRTSGGEISLADNGASSGRPIPSTGPQPVRIKNQRDIKVRIEDR
ncbi:G-protein coupled receptor moody [Sergentomyia squamirostris]